MLEIIFSSINHGEKKISHRQFSEAIQHFLISEGLSSFPKQYQEFIHAWNDEKCNPGIIRLINRLPRHTSLDLLIQDACLLAMNYFLQETLKEINQLSTTLTPETLVDIDTRLMNLIFICLISRGEGNKAALVPELHQLINEEKKASPSTIVRLNSWFEKYNWGNSYVDSLVERCKEQLDTPPSKPDIPDLENETQVKAYLSGVLKQAKTYSEAFAVRALVDYTAATKNTFNSNSTVVNLSKLAAVISSSAGTAYLLSTPLTLLVAATVTIRLVSDPLINTQLPFISQFGFITKALSEQLWNTTCSSARLIASVNCRLADWTVSPLISPVSLMLTTEMRVEAPAPQCETALLKMITHPLQEYMNYLLQNQNFLAFRDGALKYARTKYILLQISALEKDEEKLVADKLAAIMNILESYKKDYLTTRGKNYSTALDKAIQATHIAQESYRRSQDITLTEMVLSMHQAVADYEAHVNAQPHFWGCQRQGDVNLKLLRNYLEGVMTLGLSQEQKIDATLRIVQINRLTTTLEEQLSGREKTKETYERIRKCLEMTSQIILANPEAMKNSGSAGSAKSSLTLR